jgi:hypothetical protein
MECQACQYELLAAADPGQPSAEARDHLAGCTACQEWQRQLLRIEGNVWRIPVPPTQAKEVLLRRLLAEPAPRPQPVTLPLRRRPWRLPAIAAGLAAAALLLACGIWLGNFLSRSLRPGHLPPQAKGPATPPSRKPAATDKKAPAPSPLLARILALDLTLAEAATPRQRLETLAALADELQSETQAVAREPDAAKDLKALARLYEKVVRDGIVARANSVPAADRQAVLAPIADHLGRTRRQARELADRSRPDAAQPLLQIAAAAEAGDRQLHQLMQEATP